MLFVRHVVRPVRYCRLRCIVRALLCLDVEEAYLQTKEIVLFDTELICLELFIVSYEYVEEELGVFRIGVRQDALYKAVRDKAVRTV